MAPALRTAATFFPDHKGTLSDTDGDHIQESFGISSATLLVRLIYSIPTAKSGRNLVFADALITCPDKTSLRMAKSSWF
jgi:hypothetical protein